VSIQTGLLRFDASPIEPIDQERLVGAVKRYGTRRATIYAGAGIFMAHVATDLATQPCIEGQPYHFADDHVITWDGRLDNRAEISWRLGSGVDTRASDVALAAAAYARWGEGAFGMFVGDWALCIWNSRTRALLLARDFMGNRELYYAISDRGIVWSTALDALLACLPATRIDARFVVGFLTFSAVPGLTPYEDVRSLLPAHYLSVRSRVHVNLARFWNFSPTDSINYRSQDDYAEHYRTLVNDAVKARLHSPRPVWCEVSGGLDSAVIACVAQHMSRVTGRELEFINFRDPESPESNDQRFVDAVAAHLGRQIHYVESAPLTLDGDLPADVSEPGDIDIQALSLFPVMQRSGAGVVLSGRLGDTVMGQVIYDAGGIAEQLATRRILAACLSARAWSRATQRTIWSVLRDSACYLGSSEAQAHRYYAGLLHVAGVTKTTSENIYSRWSIARDHWGHHEYDVTRYMKLAADAPASKRLLLAGLYRHSLEGALRSRANQYNVSHTYPFSHRPLVAFMLAIPTSQLFVPGQTRPLMRRACVDIVPQRILNRFSKGTAQPRLVRRLRPLAAELTRDVDRLAVVRSGFVAAASLRQRLTTVLSGGCKDLGNLWRIVLVEMWLRRRAAHVTDFATATGKEVNTHDVRTA
jgi:asparagine synthase (glutamine-hydrolysing)